MTLTHWRPFGGLATMHDKINRLFDDSFRDIEKGNDAMSTWYPTVDVFEKKDEYVFKLEVPGLSKDDINVEFHNNTLTVQGEKKEDKEVKEENYHRIESFKGKFSRSFTLPKNINSKKIDAKMKDGVLELRVAKAEEAKAKSIPININ